MMTAETKPVTIEKEYKFATQIFIFTVLFAVTAIGVYLSFIVCDRTLLKNGDGNIDGIAQEYPIYAYIKHLIEGMLTGENPGEWSWDIGLGAAQMDFFKSRFLNPLTYLIIAFPEKYLDIGYNIATILRQYFSGIAFMFFAREVMSDQRQRILGAFCYTFSGWAVMSTVAHGSFTNATIVFPLLILGAEKILKKESPVLFIVSVFLFFVTGVLWAYIAGITVVVFFLVRYFYYYSKLENNRLNHFIKFFGKFIGHGIVGILISFSLVISMFISMTGATTDTQLDQYSLVYPLDYYLNITADFFSLTPIHTAFSYIFVPVICVLFIPMIVINIKKRSTPAILSVLFFAAGLFPVTGKIFNGFSYTVGRWYFVFVFFMVWAAMECLARSSFEHRKNMKIMVFWILLVAFWNIAVCYFMLDIIDQNSMFCTIIGVGFGLIILFILYTKEQKFYSREKLRKIADVGVVIILVGSVIGCTNMMFYPGVSDYLYKFEKTGSIYNKFSGSTQQAAVSLESMDKSFYRTDQVDGYNDQRVARMIVNENIYWGYRSIYCYFSTISSDWLKFNKLMGNNCGYFDRTISFSNDNRAALDTLMGVKYFLGDSDNKRPGASQYRPYGFEYYDTVDGVEVYKNKYDLGLGAGYNKYITESELLKYNYLEREQILTQAAVIPDNAAASLKNVSHADADDLETDIKTIDYQIADEQNMEISKTGRMTVYKDGGSFKLRIPEVKNCQVVVSFENLRRSPCSYEKKLSLSGKDYDTLDMNQAEKYINKVSYMDNERFKIFVSKGNVEKAAINNKGKNQGFNDITDFNINLGYYDSIDGDIDIYIDSLGEYTFDAINVYAVPMTIYDNNIQELETRKINVDCFEDDYVDCSIYAEEDMILYMSVLDIPGWEIIVDGEKAEKIDNVNIAFTGVELSRGQHRIELKYSYPGKVAGMTCTVIGIALLAGIIIYRRRLNKQ